MTEQFLTGQETEIREETIPVFVSGLPGRMATLIAQSLSQDRRFDLLPIAMTSPRHRRERVNIGDTNIQLVDYCPSDIRNNSGVIAVDFTKPQSVACNVIHYTQLGIPFIMGTSLGQHEEEVRELVENSQISALIAPNMDIGVVARQMDIDELAQSHPGIFEGREVEITESHQASKIDSVTGRPIVSATARAFQAQLERHGARLRGDIVSIRESQRQIELGVPEEFLDGHGYHWVTVFGQNGEIIYQFETKVNGRGSYVEGTISGIPFLARRIANGSRGEIFGMRDVVDGLRRAA